LRQENILKNKLNNGDIVFGTWMVIPSPTVAEIFSMSGLDFIIIDREHGPISFETAEHMVRAVEQTSCTPLLRVSANTETEILRGLEIGSHGVVIPHVNTTEDAEYSINSAKYSPDGSRGVSAYTRSSGYYSVGEKGRTQYANDNTIVTVIIESVEGIKNIGQIAALDNIDIIYIGTYDLSQSMNCIDDLHNPKMLKTIEDTVQIIRDNGKCAGVLAQSGEDVKQWVNMGIQFIPYHVDCGLIKSLIGHDINLLREIIKE